MIVQKFRDRVKEEARIRQRVAGEEFGNGKSSSSPKGEKLNVKKVHTEKIVDKCFVENVDLSEWTILSKGTLKDL